MRVPLFLSSILLCAGLCAGVATAAPVASGVLDFSEAICGGPCSNGGSISQDYGDIGGFLDVVYDRNTALPGLAPVSYWGSGYETLGHVAFTDTNAQLSILFNPAPGFSVTILGFDIAPYLNRVTNTSVRVVDAAGPALLFLDEPTPLSTAGVTSYTGPWTSASGIEILLGPDAWDVGISNIAFEINAVSAPIPLPAAVWLLGGALIGLRAIRLRP